MSARRFSWRHALAFYVGVQAVQAALRIFAKRYSSQHGGKTGEQDRKQYERQRLPAFAPPSWAFPIAWTINSAFLLAGGIHTLNLPSQTPGRKQFLASQAAAWTLYSAFSAAYFDLQSPINAAVVTIAYTFFTGASLQAAACKMKDSQAAFSLATTVAWLAIANPVGVTQAAWNYDRFWNIGPLFQPSENWTRNAG